MSKPKLKPTPAEKATLDLLRAQMFALDAQIAMMARTVGGIASIYESSSRELQSLRDQKVRLKEHAKSIYP